MNNNNTNSWQFYKSSIVGYGILYNPHGKKFNVKYDGKCITVTTIKRGSIVKIPQYIEKMIYDKLK